jgi:hypothetical protein
VKKCEYMPYMCTLMMDDLTAEQREWMEKYSLGPFSLATEDSTAVWSNAMDCFSVS